ncbi:unnamed protein product [Chondrus crispus]|uniref:Uncharacterized protein n=1 Tax=Chondrus crispus TaxID=2769 RepID=R7QNA4_CHOCR|nr:unnamed protein product [Chondrus crispus]CDF39569.1 unnamed protein product [Chondrus crispus]|eukprot:XP_005709863.1 unnamed protein product [Chondrus crispus]
MQVWSLARGTGTRIFRRELSELQKEALLTTTDAQDDAKEVQFARGIAQASLDQRGPILFCGTDTGSVHGVEYRQTKSGGITRICTMTDLTHPVVCLAGDRRESDLLAGSDQAGNLTVWSVREEPESDGSTKLQCCVSTAYTYHMKDDFFTSLGVRDKVVIGGHGSGCITFHDTEHKAVLASVVTNTKAITSIDVYEDRNLLLVAGEDGRVTTLGFSAKQGFKPVVHFSVAFESIIIGCAFSNLEGGLPRIAMLTWETCNLKQFEYKRSKSKKMQHDSAVGGTRSISSYSCVVDDMFSPVAKSKAAGLSGGELEEERN